MWLADAHQREDGMGVVGYLYNITERENGGTDETNGVVLVRATDIPEELDIILGRFDSDGLEQDSARCGQGIVFLIESAGDKDVSAVFVPIDAEPDVALAELRTQFGERTEFREPTAVV